MSARRSAGDARSAATAFRADPAVVASDHPSRRQAVALLTVLLLAAAGVAAVSYLVRPDKARSFDLLHGSVFLTDQVAPVGIDLASGKPTLRLVGANKEVGTSRPSDVALVGVQDGTLMLDRTTGEFNMVDQTGFVIKHDGGGVLLSRRSDKTQSTAVAPDGGNVAGVAGAAYIVRSGPAGTNLLLVNQSNVEAASQGSKVVKPRASLITREVAGTDAGSVAGADGDLWVLFGTGAQHTLRQLSVPAGSSTGARLSAVDHGTIDGPAAIGTATTDATGSSAVAVASANRIAVFGRPRTTSTGAAETTERDVGLRALPGLDAVVPVSNGGGRIAFLMHATSGWNVLSIATDGSGVSGPTAIAGIPAGAQLAPPAWSAGSLYTIDRSTKGGGRIYRIAPGGEATSIAGAKSYPIAARNGRMIESPNVTDAYVLARGTRVIVNSPTHAAAVALFTDNSRGPLIIQKSSAVDVSAAGGAEALTRNNLKPSNEQGNKPKNGTQPPRNAGQQINNQVDCTRTTQKPHIPVFGPPVQGSRSVTLSWTYPTLEPQDCVPSTYTISVKALSPGAATPQSPITVQGQTSTVLGGLQPSSQYSVVVTAYLHGEGTSSKSLRVATGAEGPAAPTNLQVSADSSGNWTLTWNGCGGAGNCVPVSSWRVVPSFCDGRGVSSAPAPMDVTADPSTRAQPPTVYHGSDALLGRGLQFQIEGTGTDGQPGSPSTRSACVYSWTNPVTGAITLSASAPPETPTDSTTSITAAVRFAHSATHDLGGVGGQLTYQLLSGGSVVATQGPTNSTSVPLSGVRAGQHYQVRVIATPPRHPGAAVTVGPVDVTMATAPWPAVSVNSSFAVDTYDTGTLTVSFGFPHGTDTHGETFDLVDSMLTCGSSGTKIVGVGVKPGDAITVSGINRFDNNGDCTVRIQLQQNGNGALFGAGPSGSTSVTQTIPQPTPTSKKDDFHATWSGDQNNPKVIVNYAGQDDFTDYSSSWTITVTNGSTADCGHTSEAPTATVAVSTDCIKAGGTFTVSVAYTYLGNGQHFEGIAVNGTAPQPVDPSKVKFTAAWDPSNPVVNVTYTGTEDRSKFSSLKWSESVTATTAPGVTCGSAVENPAGGDFAVPVQHLDQCPSTGLQGQYQILIHFEDPTYGQTFDKQYDVSGTPPT